MRFPDPRFMARTNGSFMQREKLDRLFYQGEDHNWPNIKEHHVPGNLK